MRKPIHGSLQTCIAYYVSDPDVAARKLLASYLDLPYGAGSVRRWFSGQEPIGASKFRIENFLVHAGYGIDEYKRLAPPIRPLLQLYAFRLVKMQDIVSALDYSPGDGSTQINRVLSGQTVPLPRRLELAEKFTQTHAHLLAETVARKNGLIAAVRSRPDSPHAEIVQLRQKTDEAGAKNALITIGAQLVRALVPIVEYIASDKCTVADRQRFRDLSGGNGVFNASTDFNKIGESLNQLCSETIRNERISRKKGCAP